MLAAAMAVLVAFLALFIELALNRHPGLEGAGDLVTISQTNGNGMFYAPYALIERDIPTRRRGSYCSIRLPTIGVSILPRTELADRFISSSRGSRRVVAKSGARSPLE